MKILELKHTIYQIENSLDGFNSRMEKIEKKKELVNWKTDKQKLSSLKKRKKKLLKNEQRFGNSWNNIKRSSTHVIRVPGEVRE